MRNDATLYHLIIAFGAAFVIMATILTIGLLNHRRNKQEDLAAWRRDIKVGDVCYFRLCGGERIHGVVCNVNPVTGLVAVKTEVGVAIRNSHSLHPVKT